MATFFGEVVHQTSRAFWDECEDVEADEEYDKRPTFHLNIIDTSKNDQFTVTIFSTDRVCTEFSSALFDLSESKIVVATIHETEKTIAKLYRISSNILLFLCTSDINLFHANELLHLVALWLDKSKEVIILLTNPVGEYTSINPKKPIQSSFVRSLKSSLYKESDVLCSRLECPNAVSGFPAAVLSWCEVQDKPCVLYVFYYASSLPVSNTINVEPFYQLVEKLKWFKEFQKDSKKKGGVTSIKIRNHILENSNLYL